MEELGKRISFYRRQRGLSQVDLAKIVGRSESWISQVERGTRVLDRISVLNKLADALEVPLSILRETDTENKDKFNRFPYLNQLRLALTGPADAGASNYTLEVDGSLMLGENLAEEIDRAWELVHKSAYANAALTLSSLINKLEKEKEKEIENNVDQFKSLISIYQATAALLSKVGEEDSAWVAADRAVRLSEFIRADYIYIAANVYRMAHVFMAGNRLDQAEYVSYKTIERLKSQEPKCEVLSLLGAFQLILAIIAAEDRDSKKAEYHLGEADRLAESIDEDGNDFNTEFGRSNVLIHKVAVAVKLGNAGKALELASNFEADSISKERYACFLIDVSRANLQMRRMSASLDALVRAEREAPEQLAEDLGARQIIKDLSLMSSRKIPELERIANRLAVSI